jgi:16S rRNA processing protein RimM
LANSSNPQHPPRSNARGTPAELRALAPQNLVVMGRIVVPFGVRGWVKIHPFTETPQGLLDYRRWWIGRDADWRETQVEQGEAHGETVVAKLAECDDRDAAALLRGKAIAVPREAFPAARENEFYWADLIGLDVVNEQDERFGRVAEVFKTGANDVLVVRGREGDAKTERLIPFLESVVKTVDLPGRVIRVDWGLDY